MMHITAISQGYVREIQTLSNLSYLLTKQAWQERVGTHIY